jgi:hypothetical protein
VIHYVSDIRGGLLVHHVVVFVYMKYVRWGRNDTCPKSPLPILKREAVPIDNEIYRTSRPTEKLFQGANGIFCKIEVVQINVQYRVHWF